jgi:hypothetical protein
MEPEVPTSLLLTLALLEDELPYVSVEALCSRWATSPGEDGSASRAVCGEAITRAIDDRLLFTDLRQRMDPNTGRSESLRLVRLNRRHPAVVNLLAD